MNTLNFINETNDCLLIKSGEANATWNLFKATIDKLEANTDDIDEKITQCRYFLKAYPNEGGHLAYTTCLQEVSSIQILFF